jgi:GMP synthase (glutamine-hydrolysing)
MFEPGKFIEEKVAEVKEAIKGNAVIAVSGGVDSTVAAIIVSRAIGDRLTAVHVDTGYMRKNESEKVAKALKEFGLNLIVVDASEEFYNAKINLFETYEGKITDEGILRELESSQSEFSKPLQEVIHPEVKRKIIGAKFIDVFEREAKKVGAKYLVQGTIAPDWIESGGGLRDNIKSHHNVGALPKKMGLKLIETNREIYKDEVRKVAKELGYLYYNRQPFPGPGLAIRIIGDGPKKEHILVLQEATEIWETTIEDAVEKEILEKEERQYLVGYFPKVKTVGVHGDVRAYNGMMALRCFRTVDYMEGYYEHLPHKLIESASAKITNKLKNHVNRIFYDCTNKPPGTTEFE